MLITGIERKGKQKFRFFIDGEYGFFLTISELRIYGLDELVNVLPTDGAAEGLSVYMKNETFVNIREEVVLPRGKKYALSLLSDRDYSVASLKHKLETSGYSAEDCEEIINYISSFNYLSDVRYALNFIRMKEKSKSRNYIENQLLLKGVSRSDINEAFDLVSEEHSQLGISEWDIKEEAINKIIGRKLKQEDEGDSAKITKVIQSLLRDGFNYSDIKKCVSDYFDDLK